MTRVHKQRSDADESRTVAELGQRSYPNTYSGRGTGENRLAGRWGGARGRGLCGFRVRR